MFFLNLFILPLKHIVHYCEILNLLILCTHFSCDRVYANEKLKCSLNKIGKSSVIRLVGFLQHIKRRGIFHIKSCFQIYYL